MSNMQQFFGFIVANLVVEGVSVHCWRANGLLLVTGVSGTHTATEQMPESDLEGKDSASVEIFAKLFVMGIGQRLRIHVLGSFGGSHG